MMKVLFVFFTSISGFAKNPSYLCRDNPEKGACLSYEGTFAVREQLPQDLSFSNFYKVSIRTSLENRNLKGSDLREVEFVNSSAIDSDFTDAKLRGLRGKGSRFRKCIFRNVDLRAAKLVYADFRDSDLREALLQESDLSFVDFRRSDLRGADLRGAWVLGTLFDQARYDRNTKLPFSHEKARQLGMIFDDKVLEKTN